ncbi:MAG: diphosphate--fructose-6-phosphate 1-phosphotransferase [Spirochaetaceae bacterium]|nr:diphosphate--fructose-6-phosphate 1-phosphotransferase [Spirochaetaceae bacterium]
MEKSVLQQVRYQYKPKLPLVLTNNLAKITLQRGQATTSVNNHNEIKELFPNSYGAPVVNFTEGSGNLKSEGFTVGAILSGGQAPGGHNVIAGLYDALKKASPNNKLFGFLGGPSGLIDNKYLELTDKIIDEYRNTGGFDMIQSGRTKLEKEEDFKTVAANCKNLGVNALVIIGGDDSNTNAAVLGEYFLANNLPIQVIGCPKTIDGDLKNELIETSFGFDTACKTFAELIGNIARDANSAQKYWHFIRLMGRSASHITLECALLTQPNVTLVGEEVEAKKLSLSKIVDIVADSVVKRAANGHNFGLVLIPEGLIEFIPEFNKLINELNNLLSLKAAAFSQIKGSETQIQWLQDELSDKAAQLFGSLPRDIAEQLMLDRDPHGNVRVSAIETEKLLMRLVESRLAELKKEGKFKGSFSPLGHFFGYEGRCAFPSNFDADYCYSLGFNACMLIMAGLSGYISSIKNLNKPAGEWQAVGTPLTAMMNLEVRHGKPKPVIKKALVELEGKPFKALVAKREEWAVETAYIYPGAIQYFGPSEVCDRPSETLRLEQSS